MTGGSIHIKVQSPNGEKIVLTGTPQSCKAGTYNRIVRSLQLGKFLIIENVTIGTYPMTPITGYAYVSPVTGYIYVAVNPSSTNKFYIAITATDTIYYTDII